MAISEVNVETCGLCGAPTPDPDTPCPNCSASLAWRDWASGVLFLKEHLVKYTHSKLLRSDQIEPLNAHYESFLARARSEVASGNPNLFPESKIPRMDLCWQCKSRVHPTHDFCASCGSPLRSHAAKTIRYLDFLARTAQDLHQHGLLDLPQAHAIEADVRSQRETLRVGLEKARMRGVDLQLLRKRERDGFIPPVTTAPTPNDESSRGGDFSRHPSVEQTSPSPAPAARRNLLEIILDPQSIQWMLASGGLLLVVGLVIYLASKGLFDNPRVIAATMGLASVGVMVAGWAILLKTRFHMAGRAITLLACLAMPFNLWFYHAQGLMTLDGHLWIPATVICLLYAASAYVLKDPLFVYVLMAGITGTGLLILTDLHQFAQITAPSILLMILGLISLHVERAFPPLEDTPFSRSRFGKAFFFSAQVLIVGSLGLLLGAQLVNWLWQPVFVPLKLNMHPPEIATVRSLKVIALAIVLAGAYSFVWSSVVVRQKVIYTYAAAFCVLWAELLLIELIGASLGAEMFIGVLAATALLAIVGTRMLGAENALARPLRPLGLLMSALALVIGILLHLRATNVLFQQEWPYAMRWSFVVALVFTGIVARLGAWANLKLPDRYAPAFFFISGGAFMVAAVGLLANLGITQWEKQAPILILIPIAYLIASKLYREGPASRPTAGVALVGAGVMVFSVLLTALHISPRVVAPVTGESRNLLLALFFFEATVFYGLHAYLRGRARSVTIAAIMACGVVWQLFSYFQLPASAFINAFALIGLMLLVVYRLALLDEMNYRRLAQASFGVGNGLLGLAFVASTFRTLAILAGHRVDAQQMLLVSSLALMSLFASFLVRENAWRRWHITSAIGSGALSAICVQQMMHFSIWQTLELFLVAVGLLVVLLAHAGWYREQGKSQSDTVSFGLQIGSLLICAPLAIAMFYNRFYGPGLSLPDEIGLLTASIALFLTGMMFKLRDTTLIGGIFLVGHLIVLIVSAGIKAQLALGVYLTLGGAALFGVGLFLALSREKLLALPDQIRRREGIFKVLSWR